MLNNFQLTAIVNQNDSFILFRIPMHQRLQERLAMDWEIQYSSFVDNIDEIPFDAGYTLETHERFVINDYDLPDYLSQESSQTVQSLKKISNEEETLESIKSIVAFARDGNNEVILFQNFSRSHVIHPGRFIFLERNTFQTSQNPGLTLDKKLCAVYFPSNRKLLFNNLRTVNKFLFLVDYYKEATEQEIRDILNHDMLAPEDVESIVTYTNQWFRKRFAMLRDSQVLDNFSPEEIKNRSNGYVDIKLENGKIVFPADKKKAKKLLQFLCEELYRGPITNTVYETNSKRKAE